MSRQEKRHPAPPEYQWGTPMKEVLWNVIADTEKELAFSRVNEWARAKEVADPVHMGVTQATEEYGLYQKHCKFLEEKIAVIRLYIQEKL